MVRTRMPGGVGGKAREGLPIRICLDFPMQMALLYPEYENYNELLWRELELTF
jgi:hypothetical protein